MENIWFNAGYIADRTYQITGRGGYPGGGELALAQSLSLEVHIDNGVTNRLCTLTNDTPFVDRLWPMMECTLTQTNGTFTQVYHLHLFAAPFREIWFSTATGRTPGIWNPPTNRISGGDVISSGGRVVKSNVELTRHLGVMPVVPDLGFDAFDRLAGGEMAFSMEQDFYSKTPGSLRKGDLLSSRGRVVKRNDELLAAFDPKEPALDSGVDAVPVLNSGEVYFSIRLPNVGG